MCILVHTKYVHTCIGVLADLAACHLLVGWLCMHQVVVDSDVERLMLMKQEKEILERQARRAGGAKVCVRVRARERACVFLPSCNR